MNTQFLEGDKVRFKTWEEMEAEYGVTGNGNIDCIFLFTLQMEECINREKVYTIRMIDGVQVYFTEEPSNENNFNYSVDMIKLVGGDDIYRDDLTNLMKYNLHKLLSKETYIRPILYSVTADLMQFCVDKKINITTAHFGRSNTVHEILEYIYGIASKDCSVLFFNITDVVADYVADCEGWEIMEFGNFLFLRRDSAYAVITESISSLGNEDAYNKFVNWFAACIGIEDKYRDMFLNKNYETLYSCLVQIKEEQEKAKKEKRFTDAIDKLSKGITDREQSVLQRRIDRFKDDMNSTYQNWINLSNRLKDAQRDLWFLQYKNQSNKIEDFIQSLIQDKDNILCIDCVGSRLHLTVKQDLLFFDTENWEDMKEGVHEGYPGVVHLLDAIFGREATLTFTTGIAFDLLNTWSSGDHVTYDGQHDIVGFPNPHIYFFNCWGDNRPEINKNVEDGNYDLAYTQSKSALAGINLTDDAVCVKFFRLIMRCADDQRADDIFVNSKCITDNETGIVMTIKEAEEYYAKREAEGHEED